MASTIDVESIIHIEGRNNINTGKSGAHVEGYNNHCSGNSSHIEGSSNDDKSIEIGFVTGGVYNCTHMEGSGNKIYAGENVYVNYTHIEGYKNTINSPSISIPGAHIEGIGNGIIVGREPSDGQQINDASISFPDLNGTASLRKFPGLHIGGYKNCVIDTTEGSISGYIGGLHVGGSGCSSMFGSGIVHGEGLYSLGNGAVFGQYNDNTLDMRDKLLIVGGGTSDSNRSNALVVDRNGVVDVNKLNTSGGDYAEMFEWADGNPNQEDRTGYAVTFDTDQPDKIRIANSSDFIIGIVSANPSVLGNNPMHWKGKYNTDKFGRVIYNDDIPEVSDNYMNDQKYTMRSQRNEWASVGMLGQIMVLHDGSLIPGKKCKVNDDGKFTISDTGYHVMRSKGDVATILFR